MKKYLKSGDISEFTIQKMIVQYLQFKGFGSFVVQLYNEGAGMSKRGKFAVQTGLRIGASDLFIMVPRHCTHGLWLEVKSKNGKLRKEQMQFLKDAESQGYMTHVTWSFDEAKEFLDWYFAG